MAPLAGEWRGDLGRFSRHDWLSLGTKLLADEGPDALSLERLTEAAGRTRGSFYHHFKGREDFLGGLMDSWRERVIEQASVKFRESSDPEILRALVRDAPFDFDHAFERAVRRLAVAEPAVSERLAQIDDERIAGLAYLISRMRPEVADPKSTAFIQYAVVIGFQWLLDSPDDPRMPALRRAGDLLFGLASST